MANAFGPSVGAKALTMKQAILVAAIFEFAGAVLMGAGVVETIRSGITNITYFQVGLAAWCSAGCCDAGGPTHHLPTRAPRGPRPLQDSPDILAFGMLCALTATGTWLIIATALGVSAAVHSA